MEDYEESISHDRILQGWEGFEVTNLPRFWTAEMKMEAWEG